MTESSSPAADRAIERDTRRTASNISVLMVTNILSKGILFAWQIVLGSLIGPTEYGIYSTVFALFAVIAPLTSMGLGMIAIRDVAKTPERIGQYASSMLVIQTTLSGVAYLFYIGTGALYNETILAYTAVAGILLIVDMFGNTAHDLFLAQEKMRFTALMEIVQIILRVVLAALALWWGYGLFGIYVATIIASALRSSVLWIAHFAQGLTLDFPVQWRIVALPMLLNALPIVAASMLSLGYDHADKLMMTGIIGETNTGYLQPAFLIHFGVIEVISTSILVAMYPLMARYYNDDTAAFGSIVEKLFTFILIVILPISLGIMLFADDIIQLLFTPDYLPTIPILRVYIWYTFLTILSNVLSKAMLVQNRQRQTLVITGAALVFNIVLNYVLLVRYGDPLGAAVASVAAQALALVLLARFFTSQGFTWGRIFSVGARLGVLGAVMLGVMYLAGSLWWIVGLLVGSLVYLLGIRFFGVLSGEDWDLLYRLTGALPGGGIIRRYWQRDM